MIDGDLIRGLIDLYVPVLWIRASELIFKRMVILKELVNLK